MSWVWSVMLSFSNEEYWMDEAEETLEVAPALEKINEWLESDKVRNYEPLTPLALDTGGVGSNANVFGGAFKHFDIEAFIDVVSSQEWRDRDNVQLFVQGEESGKWTILDFIEDTEEEE